MAIRTFRQIAGELQPSLEVYPCLRHRRTFGGTPAGNPVIGGGLGKQACLSAVISEQAGLGHAERCIALCRATIRAWISARRLRNKPS